VESGDHEHVDVYTILQGDRLLCLVVCLAMPLLIPVSVFTIGLDISPVSQSSTVSTPAQVVTSCHGARSWSQAGH